MLLVEKRKQERYSFERQPEGELNLLLNGVRLPVVSINDISNAGVSLCVAEPLAVFSPVTVEYADARVRMQVHGTVTRCVHSPDQAKTPEGQECFVVGIELVSPMLLLSMFQKY